MKWPPMRFLAFQKGRGLFPPSSFLLSPWQILLNRRRLRPNPWLPLARTGLLSLLIVIAGHPVFAANPTGQEVATQLHLRSGPGPQHPSLKIMTRGQRFEVLERRDDWLQVACEGQTGFVKDRPIYVRLDPAPEPAQPADQVAAARAQAADVAARIRRSKAQVKESVLKEENALEALAAVEDDLHVLEAQVAGLQRQLARQEAAIRQAQAQSQELEQRIRRDQDQARKRLRAYYKMMLVGKIHILASASGVYDLLARDKAMQRIVKEDDLLLERLDRDSRRQAVLLAGLKQGHADRLGLQAELDRQAGRLAEEKGRRQRLLEQVRADKSLQLQALAALQQQAKDLDRRLGELKGEAAAAGPPPETNSKPFRELKGLLNLPVNGMMVTRFGPYRNEALNVMNFRSGVDMRTEPGTAVQAVCGGRVLFAEGFRGYGNMVILDHGDSYYTVYAHMESLAKRKGEPVAAGETLGAVGRPGIEGFAKVYFEVRHHGKPQDPAQWLKSR